MDVIFNKILTIFFLTNLGNHLNPILSKIFCRDMLCSTLLVHTFFTDLFTKTKIDILFL